MNHLLLIVHLLAATVWVGGNLFIACRVLPAALRRKETGILLQFEKQYEPLGMSALALLLLTGLWMAYLYGVKPQDWFSFSNPIERVVSVKLLLLLLTLLLALSAQIRVIPKLQNDVRYLPEMAVHIIAVTITGMAMLVIGSFVRFGGL